MSLYPGRIPNPPVGLTEFEILKASHKFLRDENAEQTQALTDDQNTNTRNTGDVSWNDQLAAKYYASLYREFALCDLKHYKSGNFALRWRTEDEVLSGAGETTCGNTRCEHHHLTYPSSSTSTSNKVPLTTLELPFSYTEHGENKSALVKVVLCGKCVKKLMWKMNKEKAKGKQSDVGKVEDVESGGDAGGNGREKKSKRRVSDLEEAEKEQESREILGKSKKKRDRDIVERKDSKLRSLERGVSEHHDNLASGPRGKRRRRRSPSGSNHPNSEDTRQSSESSSRQH